jgi:hypothetical protein
VDREVHVAPLVVREVGGMAEDACQHSTPTKYARKCVGTQDRCSGTHSTRTGCTVPLLRSTREYEWDCLDAVGAVEGVQGTTDCGTD